MIVKDEINLAAMIDHTLLKPDATTSEVLRYCDEAILHRFCSVVVNPVHVRLVHKRLDGSGVKTAAVVGFPFGANLTVVKALEAERAISEGADEIDIVIDIGALKGGRLDLVQGELQDVRRITVGTTLKVIIEACLLTNDEKIAACNICTFIGAEFVKTSTGYSSGGATIADVALLRDVVGPQFGVKASGGIRTRNTAFAMVKAGASRIGTSVGPALLATTEEGNYII